MTGRVNKISYFLWRTKKENITIKDNTVNFLDENGLVVNTSDIEKTHVIEIFLLKILPAWILFGFLVHIPKIQFILIGTFIFLMGGLVIKFIPKYFKKFLIMLSLIGLFYIIPNNGLELPFEQIVYVVAMIILFLFLIRETFCLFYEDQYYFLEDVEVKIDIKGTRTRPGKKKVFFNKIPFFGLTNKEKRVNLGKMSFSGYYLKVKKDEND